jgi:hypothetical protein
MIRRFSAFFSSATFVKLNDPVTTVALSIIMILLWAMACLASMYVGMPAFIRKVADVLAREKKKTVNGNDVDKMLFHDWPHNR